MAKLIKYTAVIAISKHNVREATVSSNPDIDPERTAENYSLAPADRGNAQPDQGRASKRARAYFKERMREVYKYNRKDVVTACEWVVTAPKDLKPEQENEFFRAAYDYMNSKYSEKNVIQAIVHKDEAGQPHLHYLFAPVVQNEKYQQPNRYGNITGSALYKEKLCANDLIDRRHLQHWHDDLQRWLDDRGIHATVKNGATEGSGKTVTELKRETLEKELEAVKDHLASVEKENAQLQERLEAREQDRQHEVIQSSGWGEQRAWGSSEGWGTHKGKEEQFTWGRD